MSPRILFVFTSADKTLTGTPTGWYLPEAAHPYYVLSPHYSIDFASPAGPNPPLDQQSAKSFKDDAESVKFLQDETAKSKFAHAKKLSEVDAGDYHAVFYVGGHGPVIDLPFDPVNIKLASQFYRQGKIVAAVCHGPAALVGATDYDETSIFAGRAFTGFSNQEEEIVGGVNLIPFLLETKITSLGGTYEHTDPWQPLVVVSGKLITGQNPASARPLAEKLHEILTEER